MAWPGLQTGLFSPRGASQVDFIAADIRGFGLIQAEISDNYFVRTSAASLLHPYM
jgi:hypothetical protein